MVADKKLDDVIVLSNFESSSDIKKWEKRASSFERSDEYSTEGKYSGKAILKGGVKCSNVLLEDFFKGRKKFSNWSRYDYLKFDMYNSSESLLD